MTQRHANAGDELVDAEGLGDVVVGTQFQRVHNSPLVRAAGQDHDRKGQPLFAPLTQQLVSSHVRQAEVEENEVGLVVSHLLSRGASACGLKDRIALGAEAYAYQLSDRELIVHHQYSYT